MSLQFRAIPKFVRVRYAPNPQQVGCKPADSPLNCIAKLHIIFLITKNFSNFFISKSTRQNHRNRYCSDGVACSSATYAD